MTYWRYWQLNAAPFTDDSPRAFFQGGSVQEALARIEFLIGHDRQVGTLVGDSGSGKSALLRFVGTVPTLTPQAPNVQWLYTSMLGKSEGELVGEIASRLSGRRWGGNSLDAWRELCDYFVAAEREDLRVALLVDDVESAGAGAEVDLHRLLSKPFSLTLILAVQTQLIKAVGGGLIERSELQIELPAWPASQTAEFLAHLTRSLGRAEPVFTDRAITQIHQLSQGNPRRIIQLTDLALVAGAVSQADFIDVDCIEQVAWELPNNIAA